jgi:hypothetical protein
MRSVLRLGVFTVAGAFTLAVLPSAAAQTATFSATPASGPPGTSIVLSSVTQCRLPAGVTGQPLVRATLSRGSTVISAATIPVAASGSWTGTLRVGRLAASGVDTIEAFCLASPQAEGALLAYSPRTFTVTAPTGLAGTGFDSWPAAAGGAALVLGGSLLLLASRRRLPAVDPQP